MILDTPMTAETVEKEDTKAEVVDTKTTPKMAVCNSDIHNGEREFKLGFNFREATSEVIPNTNPVEYKAKEVWYNNLCKPCGQQLLKAYK